MLLLSDVFTRLNQDNQIICAFVAVIFSSCTVIRLSLRLCFQEDVWRWRKKDMRDRFGSQATSSHRCCLLVWTASGPGRGKPGHVGPAALVRHIYQDRRPQRLHPIVSRETSELPVFREHLSTRWDAENRSTIPLTESITGGRVRHPWSLAPVLSPPIGLAFTSYIFITFLTTLPFLWVDNLKRFISGA